MALLRNCKNFLTTVNIRRCCLNRVLIQIRRSLWLARNLSEVSPSRPLLQQSLRIAACVSFHTSSPVSKGRLREPQKWPQYNEIVYPPQKEGEPRRPAEVCHMRTHIKYSPAKMWYIAAMIRGMSIEEAMKQLSFYKRKGAVIVKEVLEEAQEMAVRDHNVEFKSNLWIESSFSGKSLTIKGVRKHRGPRYGLVHYRYCHYFVRLREGSPPKHYYPPPPTGFEKMEEYLREQRSRRILHSL